MKRWILAAVSTAALAAPAVAQAASPQLTTQYTSLYKRARASYGAQAVGCNLVGPVGSCHVTVTDSRLRQSIGVLQRMLAPAPVYRAPVSHTSYHSYHHYASTTHTYTAPTTHYSSGGAGGVPACASESGTNYSTGSANTNGSSGATGRYQITPGTAANYGCNLGTPAGQDACAQQIYAHQGASAWVGCGG